MAEIVPVEKTELIGEHFDQLVKVYAEFYKTADSGGMDATVDLKGRLLGKDSLDQWFLAFENTRIVGFLVTGCFRPNGKSGWFEVFTLPGFDPTGTELLGALIRHAREKGIERLRTNSSSQKVWELVERFGGTILNSSAQRVLEMRNCDWGVVDNWLKIKNNDWIVKRYDSISEELVDEIADLSFEACNEVSAMDGNVVNEDRAEHVEWLKSLDKVYKDADMDFICFTASQKSGEVLGFIEGSISRSEPDFFLQRLIAVKQNQRGRGIGKHLKALMMNHLRTGHPEIVRLKTCNNVKNLPAIALNEALGFQVAGVYRDYRIVVDEAIGRLDVK